MGDALPDLAYDVTATTVVLGALAARDWRPMHHDYDFAVNRNGTQDIFLNTPEPGRVVRALPHRLDRADRAGSAGCASGCGSRCSPATRWCSPASSRDVSADDTGCGWVELDLTLRVGDVTCTESEAQVALPTVTRRQPVAPPRRRWSPERAT